jgi:hypothetical protein
MKKHEVRRIEDIKLSKWRALLQHIANRKLALVVGDDLIKVNGESLNKYLSRKLYNNTLRLLKEFYDGEEDKFEDWIFTEFRINTNSEPNEYFSFEIMKLYDESDECGSVDLFIQKEIGNISKESIDVSVFRRILDKTEPRIIVSTCYCSLLLKEFIDYALTNGLKPYIGEILGGDSSGGFTFYRQEYDSGKIAWKDGNIWEGKKGEIIYLTIGGDFDSRNESLYNLCGSEDDWVKKMCKWIVSVQTQGNTSLINQMTDSYLLVLGTSIPSWAFRFLWYTLSNPLCRKKANQMGDSLAARPEPHNPNVRRFITSYDAMVISAKETENFANDMINRWIESPDYQRFKNKSIESYPNNEHIFVSYLSNDRNEVEKYLIPLLQKVEARHGYKFWYDQKSLHGGDYWDFKIKDAIEKAQCFIPFLTTNCREMSITEETRYLQVEWRNALQKSKQLREANTGFGLPRFILPITLGADIEIGHFAAFQSVDITSSSTDDICLLIDQIIREYRNYR